MLAYARVSQGLAETNLTEVILKLRTQTQGNYCSHVYMLSTSNYVQKSVIICCIHITNAALGRMRM